MIRELLAEGKGGIARDRLKEAGAQTCEPTDRNRISRPSPWGERAQHRKALRSGDTVPPEADPPQEENAAVVQRQSMTLIRGDLTNRASRVSAREARSYGRNPEATRSCAGTPAPATTA